MKKKINLQLFADNIQLSSYDDYFLSPEDKKAITDIKSKTVTDPANMSQYHQFAEDIRAKYGYSGGADGFNYIKIQTPNQNIQNNMPGIPQVADYSSSYTDLINQSLNSVLSSNFSYNPDTDPSYQAFVKRATALGEEAFANNIGGLSATTGGRLNSWAATAASKARESYALQAANAVGEFEDKAYSRFMDQRSQKIDTLGLLMDLDQRDYSRYQDRVSNTLNNYQLELDQYDAAIRDRKQQLDEAMQRTKTLGYVNNDDSVLLGIPPGTLSYEATNRIADMNDWITQQEKQIEFEKKSLENEFEYEKRLLALKESYNPSKSTKQTTNSFDGDPTNDKFTKEDGKTRDSMIKEYNTYIKTDEFRRLQQFEKNQYVNDYIDKILDDNAHGILADWVADEILTEISKTPEYKSTLRLERKSPNDMIRDFDISNPLNL